MNIIVFIFKIIPKNLLSLIVGRLFLLSEPRFLANKLIKGFVWFFKIDLQEAERPVDQYYCIQDLFTRKLKEGKRRISPPICSPADGVLSLCQKIENNTALQVKGITYPVEKLVFGSDQEQKPQANQFSWAINIYLAPHNYHRVHSPFSGEIASIRYIPGKLFPVNRFFVTRLPDLFVSNERLVFGYELSNGGRAFVVMIGAFNVGRMNSKVVPGFFTNSFKRQFFSEMKIWDFSPKKSVQIGEEIGVFNLGSTVVMIFDEISSRELRFKQPENPVPIKMGESLLMTIG